ncbi:MAG: sigma-54 dependent transcriptional regulator [Gemmatimonadota bacterium]
MSLSQRPQPRILAVLPETGPSKELVAFLGTQGFEVLWSREGQSAYDIIDSEPVDGLVCHVHEARIDGLRLVQVARKRNPDICAIVTAGPEEIELGTEAMRQGAYDFQVRPVNLAKLHAVLERGLSYQRLVGEITDLHRRLDERYRFGGIVRRSSAWQRIYSQVEQVARSKASVLLAGETGTGKGEVAKAIHQHSPRRDRAFVETNCGALPEGIIESELFGHERGAFTGATTSHKGRFELADLGTLFLDEVGELALATQVKLLRVIQSGEFERVGGTETRRVDVRLIAATNRNLEAMVETGAYRADLFYRLNVVAIEIPPLRACREDIPILVDEFLRQFAGDNDRQVHGLTSAAMDALIEYGWPGNVRELKNCVEGMVVMHAGSGTLDLGDVPHHIRLSPGASPPGGFGAGMTMREIEKQAIAETLKAVDYNRRRAAAVLDIGLSTLYRKEKEYGLRS